MPVVDCIRFGGKVYCYDNTNNKVLVYDVKVINLSECPDHVLAAFINNKDTTKTVETDK